MKRFWILPLLVLAGPALGHTLGQSYSVWRIDDQSVSASFNLPAAAVAVLAQGLNGGADPVQSVVDHVHEGLRPIGRCERLTGPVHRVLEQAGFLQIRWSWRCQELIGAELAAIFEFDPQHVHTTRVVRDGEVVQETVLNAAAPRIDFTQSAPQSFLEVMRLYLNLGVEHILLGYDHLAFLAALMLVVRAKFGASLASLVWLITGFTAGHSLSLGLAVFGWLSVDSQLVEALIGFTIWLVAFEFFCRDGSHRAIASIAVVLGLGVPLLAGHENAWLLAGLGLLSLSYLAAPPSPGFRLAVHLPLTAGFGLIHGLGFAGSLAAIGLPDERIAPALLGFNLGVEVGQVLAIGVVLGLLWRLRPLVKRPWIEPATSLGASVGASVCALVCVVLGVFWFTERLL